MSTAAHTSVSPTANPPAPSAHQVPTLTRFLWSLTSFASGIMGNFATLANQIYIDALNYNPNLVSTAVALPMFTGFVTGPAIGHLCDNTRSRYGRRKPWMLVGLLLSCFLGLAFWYLPHSDKQWHLAPFLLIAALFLLQGNLAAGAFGTAAGAMGYEMTTDYNERTHIFKWGSYLGALAGLVGPWLLPMCFWFEGPSAKASRGADGIILVAGLMGLLMLATGLPAILFCREKLADHVGEKNVPFFSAIRMTLDNRPFWLLVVSNFIMRFGTNITGLIFLYLLIYHVGKGDHALGANSRAVMYDVIALSTFLATAPLAKLTDHIGKKATLLLTLVMSALAYASLWFTFTTRDWAYVHLNVAPALGYLYHAFSSILPASWDPGPDLRLFSFQWPCLITAVFIGAFTNTMPMIKSSMLADVCDLDELKHGHRREGFYSSVFGVCDIVSIAVAKALTGILLTVSAYNADLKTQSDSTTMIWLVSVVISQPLGFLIAITSILFYPLSRQRMAGIRAQIDARKQSFSAVGGFEVLPPRPH